MGLLTEGNLDENYEIAKKIIFSVCNDFHENRETFTTDNDLKHYLPMSVKCAGSQILHICKEGEKLFASSAFPTIPGPYKRAAAFLVLGRLYPVFDLTIPFSAEVTNSERKKTEKAWHSRLILRSLPPIFVKMNVQFGKNVEPLPNWIDFPSNHYLLEVLNLLNWLQQNEQWKVFIQKDKVDWDRFSRERIERAVLAISLIIESSHYVTSEKARNTIMGRTKDCLSELSVEQKKDLKYFEKEV